MIFDVTILILEKSVVKHFIFVLVNQLMYIILLTLNLNLNKIRLKKEVATKIFINEADN